MNLNSILGKNTVKCKLIFQLNSNMPNTFSTKLLILNEYRLFMNRIAKEKDKSALIPGPGAYDVRILLTKMMQIVRYLLQHDTSSHA